jgi:hypothetical protein
MEGGRSRELWGQFRSFNKRYVYCPQNYPLLASVRFSLKQEDEFRAGSFKKGESNAAISD